MSSNINNWWAEEEGEDGASVVPGNDGWIDFDITKAELVRSSTDVVIDGKTSKISLPSTVKLTVDERGLVYNFESSDQPINILKSNWGGTGVVERPYTSVKPTYSFLNTLMYTTGVFPLTRGKWAVVGKSSSVNTYYIVLTDAPAGDKLSNLQMPFASYSLATSYRPLDAVMHKGLAYFLCNTGYDRCTIRTVDLKTGKWTTVCPASDDTKIPTDFGARLDPAGRQLVAWGRYTPAGGTQTVAIRKYTLSKPFDLATKVEEGMLVLPANNGSSYGQGLDISKSGKWMVFGKYASGTMVEFQTYRLKK